MMCAGIGIFRGMDDDFQTTDVEWQVFACSKTLLFLLHSQVPQTDGSTSHHSTFCTGHHEEPKKPTSPLTHLTHLPLRHSRCELFFTCFSIFPLPASLRRHEETLVTSKHQANSLMPVTARDLRVALLAQQHGPIPSSLFGPTYG